MFPSVNEQIDAIRKGAVEIIPEDELAAKIEKSIKSGKPLNVKLGCDPSKPDLHIGHAVVLHKMRQFQDLGHKAILVIGDFTAMIGDPSGKSKTRPQLSMEQTKENGRTYLEQATIILSEDRLEVKYNSDWLSKLNFADVIKLASNYTVAQLLERDDFHKRYNSGTPISLHEFLYPMAQAMDSVAIESDVELGGTDQTFNLLVGREIQKTYGKEPQCLVTMPLLEGTGGKDKMSKSLDNYISITEEPKEIFGKVMSIPDELIATYYRYGAWASKEEVKKMEDGLKDGSLHPRAAKVKVAKAIAGVYCGEEAAEAARKEFDKIFVKKKTPDKIEEVELDLDSTSPPLADVLATTKLTSSKSEARRMIKQKAVSIDDKKETDIHANIDLSEQRLIKVGKRKFLKVKVKK